jgi:hypothetical protein
LNGGYATPAKPSSAGSHYSMGGKGGDYSFDSTTMDDVDTTRCFPFGMIFGSSGNKKKNRKHSNTSVQGGRPACPSTSSAPSVSSPSVSSPGGGRCEETMVNFTSSLSSPQSSPSQHQQQIQNDRVVIPVISNMNSESFSSTSLVNTLVDLQKSSTILPSSTSVSGRSGIKPLNLAEVQNGNLSSTSHSSRSTPRSPQKSDRSKSSLSTTHGNLIINNSDEIISSSRMNYPPSTQINQPQYNNNNPALKSSKDEDDVNNNNNNSTSQFPPDIRSKIRTAPLGDKDSLHYSKKDSTITSISHLDNGSSDNISPVGRKVNKKRNSPSPNRTVSASDRSFGAGNGSSPSIKGSISFDESYSPTRNGGVITHSSFVNEVPPSILPLINATSNDIINHNKVKPAVSSASSSSSSRISNETAAASAKMLETVQAIVENNKNFNLGDPSMKRLDTNNNSSKKKSDKSSNSSTVQTTSSNISSPPVSAHMVSPPMSLQQQPAAIIETLYRENSGNVNAQRNQQQPSQPTKQHHYPNSRHYNSHEGSSCVIS